MPQHLCQGDHLVMLGIAVQAEQERRREVVNAQCEQGGRHCVADETGLRVRHALLARHEEHHIPRHEEHAAPPVMRVHEAALCRRRKQAQDARQLLLQERNK